MRNEFSANEVRSVDFGLCHELPEGERYTFVPVDSAVKAVLKEMLDATVSALRVGDGKWDTFELAEKYGSVERLTVRLDQPCTAKLRALFAAENLQVNASAIKGTDTLAYYFATFRDGRNRKLMGIRRATQFKGVIKARNRLVRLLDDSLKLVDDDIFKLDQDYDYLLTGDHVWILRPAGFVYTAGIEDVIAERVTEMVTDLDCDLPTVCFSALSDWISSHRRASRLVAALHSRKDLPKTSMKRLKALCKENGIEVGTKNGRIIPQEGFEMAFLEMLDRRRYRISLVDNETELYVALGRRLTTNQATGNGTT